MNVLERIVEKRFSRIKTEGCALGAAVPSERAFPLIHFGTDPFIICEIKRRSPSRGAINTNLDPVTQAGQYIERGINAISVLTETDHFAGNLEDLMAVKRAYPRTAVLRKDFLLVPEDIAISHRAGADAVLLIASILEKERIHELYDMAMALGMVPLVEVHDHADIEKVRELQPVCTGINARDLKTFSVDLTVPLQLQEHINWKTRLVFESGMWNEEDAAFAAASGFAGILVGEAVVRNPERVYELMRGFKSGIEAAAVSSGASPAFFWRRLFKAKRNPGPFIKICGLTRSEDVEYAQELGADILGFVFADSPRRANAELLSALPAKLPIKSAVVVTDRGRLPEEVEELLKAGLLDVVQFHGNEAPEDCYRGAFPYYKALRLKDLSDVDQISAYRCPRVLVDAYSTEAQGGTGRMIDSDLVNAAANKRPLWLAGGIDPDNIRSVLETHSPELIDVSSRLEESPGKKDHGRMYQLFSEIDEWRATHPEEITREDSCEDL